MSFSENENDLFLRDILSREIVNLDNSNSIQIIKSG